MDGDPQGHPPGGQNKRLGLFVAAGAVLAFIAGVLGNLQSIVDFWNRHVSPPDSRYELKAYPNGVEAQPIPLDEPLPPDLRNTQDERNSTANTYGMVGLHAPGAVAPPNFYRANFGSAVAAPRPQWVTALQRHATNAPRGGEITAAPSPVIIEAVQTPREHQLYDLWFDVFLRNSTDEDLLFVSVAYISRVEWARGGGEDSGALLPNALYQIPYALGGRGTVALGPPYRLSRHSRGAIRFRFRPTNQTEVDMGLSHWLDVWIIDSQGRSRKIIRFPA